MTNFTYTLIALGNLTIDKEGKVVSSRVGMYGYWVSIWGVVNTTAQGCKAGQGLGKGMASNDVCTATGGAHGGRGGMAINYATRPTLVESSDSNNLSDDYQDYLCS